MMHQIFFGSILIMVTVVVESVFIALAAKWLTANRDRLGNNHSVLRNAGLLGLVTLWLLAGISIGLWIWALLFLQIGEFDSLTGEKTGTMEKIHVYANSHYVAPKPTLSRKSIIPSRPDD